MKPPAGRCSRSGLCSQGTDAAADAAKHPAAQPRLRPGRSGCCGCEQPAPAAADAAAAAGLMESSALAAFDARADDNDEMQPIYLASRASLSTL